MALIGGVGSAGVVGLAAVVTVLVCAQDLALQPLSSTAGGLAVVAVFMGVGGATYGWCLRTRTAPPDVTVRGAVPSLATAAPTVLMIGYALAGRLLPAGTRNEWFLGGDHVRHVVLAAELQADGGLDYTTEVYPRAWHALLSATWTAAGLDPRRSLVEVIDLTALLVWLLAAGMALTTSALAATLAHRVGTTPHGAGVAAFVAGCIVLWPPFLANYQALGLQGSVVGACVLAAVLRHQLVDTGGLRAFVVAVSGCVVLAHTWQLLLPVTGLAAAWSGLSVLRRSRGRARALVGVLGAGSVAASWPAMAAVVNRVGVGHAAEADIHAPVPWLVLGLGLVAAIVLAVRSRLHEVPWFLGLLWVPAVTGAVLAWRVGVSPESYYPSKLLWHTALLSLPSISVVGVALAVRVDRSAAVGSSLLRVLGGAAAALVLLYAVVGPTAAYTGGWSTVDGATVLRLLGASEAARAQVVHSDGRLVTDTVTRILLDAERPEHDERTPQESLSIEEECALLEEADDPTVLTDRPVPEIRERYSCVTPIVVVRPG
ncbi:hypothetical protein JQN72_17130 [Phycicoccus sp. CSK15P-2]|uniref:hypothetical protein n=1 Tax=Phycicoccus sp. CSK15P-2 TaxID=2807627 RepID=UPI001950845C|nr:hypothetical protein [Phycicoccus sp. CSK15P-2]MBM6405968.1 hypothetical protein [Phycicoccus sp. CSK15P-2]